MQPIVENKIKQIGSSAIRAGGDLLTAAALKGAGSKKFLKGINSKLSSLSPLTLQPDNLIEKSVKKRKPTKKQKGGSQVKKKRKKNKAEYSIFD